MELVEIEMVIRGKGDFSPELENDSYDLDYFLTRYEEYVLLDIKASRFVTIDLEKKRKFICAERELKLESQKKGIYMPNFEERELTTIFIENYLVYNIWQSKYKATIKELYYYLKNLKKVYMSLDKDYDDSDQNYNVELFCQLIRINPMEHFLKRLADT